MDRVMITGAAGYIGRHLLSPLLNRGYEVHVVDIVPNGVREEGLVWHTCDLLDHTETAKLVRRIAPKKMIHLAWNVGPGYSTSPSNLDWVAASLNLMNSFKDVGGKRAIFAGSSFEYDPRYGYCVENLTPTTPPQIYGKSKAALSNLVCSFAEQHGISLAWTRFFPSYGPNEKPSRLVPAVINSILTGKPVKVGVCNTYQDYSYVQDLGEAAFALFESDVRGPVNIASGRPIPLRDIVTKISELMNYSGKIQWGAVPPSSNGSFSVAATERLNNEVGWLHQVELCEGLQRTIDWWKQNNRERGTALRLVTSHKSQAMTVPISPSRRKSLFQRTAEFLLRPFKSCIVRLARHIARHELTAIENIRRTNQQLTTKIVEITKIVEKMENEKQNISNNFSLTIKKSA